VHVPVRRTEKINGDSRRHAYCTRRPGASRLACNTSSAALRSPSPHSTSKIAPYRI